MCYSIQRITVLVSPDQKTVQIKHYKLSASVHFLVYIQPQNKITHNTESSNRTKYRRKIHNSIILIKSSIKAIEILYSKFNIFYLYG